MDVGVVVGVGVGAVVGLTVGDVDRVVELCGVGVAWAVTVNVTDEFIMLFSASVTMQVYM